MFVFRYVFWYHNDRMVNYDSERGISVTTTPSRKTHSTLHVQRADVADSGNYTCAPSGSLPASIHVFVSARSEVKPWVTSAAVAKLTSLWLVSILTVATKMT